MYDGGYDEGINKSTIAIAIGLNVDFDIASEDSNEDIINTTYFQILNCLIKSPVKLNLFVTGKSLDILQNISPAFINEIKNLMMIGKIELSSFTYAHPIIPLISIHDVDKHITLGKDIEKNIINDASIGFLPPEWAWDPPLINILKKNQYQWMLLTDTNCLGTKNFLERDIFKINTLKGPHGDEIDIVLSICGDDLRMRDLIFSIMDGEITPEEFAEKTLQYFTSNYSVKKNDLETPLLIYYFDAESSYFYRKDDNTDPINRLFKAFEILIEQYGFNPLTISDHIASQQKFAQKKTITPRIIPTCKPFSRWKDYSEKLDMLINEVKSELSDAIIRGIPHEKAEEVWKYLMLAQSSDSRLAFSGWRIDGLFINEQKRYGCYDKHLKAYDYAYKAMELIQMNSKED